MKHIPLLRMILNERMNFNNVFDRFSASVGREALTFCEHVTSLFADRFMSLFSPSGPRLNNPASKGADAHVEHKLQSSFL